MHILLFYVLLTLLSLNHVQGKTQHDGYTIELVPRYSPKSPYYNSSMTLHEHVRNLARHSRSRHHRHVNRIKGNEYDTDIIPNDGDYLIEIAVGSPPVDLFAIADTGSDLVWFQCQPCEFCYPQTTAIFDPTKSSSYSTLPCNSTYCAKNNPNFQCDNSTNQCEYFYAYGNGSTMSVGIMGMDLFTFASHPASASAFGCGLVQDGDFDSDAAGLVGLGSGPLSLISQLGSTIANKFSYCLSPTTSNTTSRLRLGGKQRNKHSKLAVTTPLVTQDIPIYYVINLEAIRIGGQQQEIAVNKGIVVDSGSTLTSVDAGTYSRVESLVKKAITTHQPMANPPEGLRLCYEKDSSNFESHLNVTFRLDGGHILFKDTNLFLDMGDYVCFAIVPSDEEDDPIILGNVSQVNFEVEFDLKAKTVSFTPTICDQNHGAQADPN